jgi:hypothetical protein
MAGMAGWPFGCCLEMTFGSRSRGRSLLAHQLINNDARPGYPVKKPLGAALFRGNAQENIRGIRRTRHQNHPATILPGQFPVDSDPLTYNAPQADPTASYCPSPRVLENPTLCSRCCMPVDRRHMQLHSHLCSFDGSRVVAWMRTWCGPHREGQGDESESLQVTRRCKSRAGSQPCSALSAV